MSDQTKPAEGRENEVQDPASSYERAKPENEAGMGSLESIDARPSERPDREEQAVKNAHPSRQVNADDVENERAESSPTKSEQSTGASAEVRPEQPDHSMHEEEPLGWDQAPTDIHDPRHKRQSRKEGKGGTP